MKLFSRFAGSMIIPACMLTSPAIMGQCTNGFLNPVLTIAPDPSGEPTVIITCSTLQEYSRIGPVIPGAAYRFTRSEGGYATVRQGSVDGTVLGNGFAPLTVVATTSEDLFVHWNTDAQCGTAVGCATTMVQLFPDCVPPEATATATDDCVNGQFSIALDLTSLGDGPSVALTYEVDGGAGQTVDGLLEGLHVIGPFNPGQTVDVTLAQGGAPDCAIHLDSLHGGVCAVPVDCGSETPVFDLCYQANMDTVMAYQGNGTTPLALQFSGGQLEACCDGLTIHDGPTAAGPVLFQGNNSGQSLAGLTVQSVGPSNALTMVLHSDAFVSCATGGFEPMQWSVACLDCSPPGVGFEVANDCANGQFFVDVEVSGMGSSNGLELTNDGGAPAVAVSVPGSYPVGPFPIGEVVNISVSGGDDPLCDVVSGPLEAPLCPVVIACGVDTVEENYCFTDNEEHAWYWHSADEQPLYILFHAGGLQATEFDSLRIHDGPDADSPLLYANPGGFQNVDLTGTFLTTTGPDLFMTFRSNSFIDCAESGLDPWQWEVSCLVDCTVPAAGFTVIPDCLHHTYRVAVDVASTGSSSTVRLVNSALGDTMINVAAGITLTGPIAMDSATVITVLNAVNDLCFILSPELNSPAAVCSIAGCGPETYSYCYPDADSAIYTYVGTSTTDPVTLEFTGGELLANDNVQVFDGLNPNAPLLFSGNNGGNVAGSAYTSTNSSHALTLRILSDTENSCASGDTDAPLSWSVACGTASVPEWGDQGFQAFLEQGPDRLTLIFPGSINGNARLKLVDMTGRTVHDSMLLLHGSDRASIAVGDLPAGNYAVVVITVDGVRTKTLGIYR